jgi:hypothetical protein
LALTVRGARDAAEVVDGAVGLEPLEQRVHTSVVGPDAVVPEAGQEAHGVERYRPKSRVRTLVGARDSPHRVEGNCP